LTLHAALPMRVPARAGADRAGPDGGQGPPGPLRTGPALILAALEHLPTQQHVYRAGAAMAWQAGGERQYLRMLAQPGVDVALENRPAAILALRLAMGNADTAHLDAGRLVYEVP